MRALGCGLACALTAASASLAAEKVVTSPDWAERPTPRSIAEAFPKIAQMIGVEGRAVVSCEISAKAVLERCKVLWESPAGMGFGQATLGLTKSFKMTPKTVDGVPVDGGVVRIPLTFKIPARPRWSNSTAAGSEVFGAPTPRALDLANQIVESQTGSEAQVKMELSLMDVVDTPMPGVDDVTRDDAIAAIRAAYNADVAAMKADVAKAYAGTFTEAELADIATFFSSPGGQAMKLRGGTLGAAMAPLGAKHSELVAAAAYKAFCDKHPCNIAAEAGSPPPPKP